jgi:uncharacterized membrane protein YfcA
MNPESSEIPPQSDAASQLAAPAASFNWLLFISVMVSPVILTSSLVLFGFTTGDLAPVIGFFGGIVAGIICGIQLGRRLGKTMGIKILLSLIFVAVMAVVSVAMNCCGCLASGYQLNLH